MTETGLVLILIYLIIFKHRNLNIAVIIYSQINFRWFIILPYVSGV